MTKQELHGNYFLKVGTAAMPSLTAVFSVIMNSDSALKMKSAVSKLKVAALRSNGNFHAE